jgi:hypothetical protein
MARTPETWTDATVASRCAGVAVCVEQLFFLFFFFFFVRIIRHHQQCAMFKISCMTRGDDVSEKG